MERHRKYCIVGAGPSGLCMAAELRRRGIVYDHFEKHTRLGGVWEIENPGSPMYQSAHLISSKTMSGFWDFPFPASYPDYPRHDQVLAYLKAYAAYHELEPGIQFSKTVEEVVPDEEGAWVTVQGERRRYVGVICASGINWEPRLPQIPGTFSGEQRHAVSYASPNEFIGKRVLIIGLGNSGADIACDAARTAQRAVVSVRRGYYFLPKHVFGVPLDVFGHQGPPLPLWLETRVFSWILKLLLGDVTRLGMPRPDHALLDTHPVVNDQLIHHLRHGDVSIRGDVQSFDRSYVQFTDGSREEFDLILYATGYTRRITYLDPRHLDPGSWAAAQLLTCFSRQHPTLFTLGFAEINGALFPFVSRLAILVAELARLREVDFGAAERFFTWTKSAQFDLSGGRHLVQTERHLHYCDDRALMKALRKAFSRLNVAWPLSVQASPLMLPAASGAVTH